MSEDQTVRFAIQTLMEVVESEKSMEVCIIRANGSELMSEEAIGKIVAVEK